MSRLTLGGGQTVATALTANKWSFGILVSVHAIAYAGATPSASSDAVLVDSAGKWGLAASSSGGNKLHLFQHDGAEKSLSVPVTLSTFIFVHGTYDSAVAGGTLKVGYNGVTTSTLTGVGPISATAGALVAGYSPTAGAGGLDGEWLAEFTAPNVAYADATFAAVRAELASLFNLTLTAPSAGSSTLVLSGVRAPSRVGRAQVVAAASLSLRGASAFGRVARGSIQSSATVAPRGVPAHAHVGRATIAASNTITLTGAHAEARPSRGAFLSVATLALSGVRSRARLGPVAVTPGTVTMALIGAPSRARVGTSPFTALASLALAGVEAPARVGRAVVQPGTVILALQGVEASARAGRAVLAPANVITLSGVRAVVEVGRAQFGSFLTIALGGISSSSAVGTGTVTSSATIALRGVAARPRVGVSTIAPGSLTLSLIGARATAKPSSGVVTSLYTFAPAGVPARVRVTSGALQSAALLALAGVRGAAEVGRATIVPGDVALALRGVVAEAKLGPVVFFVGGGAPITLALAGVSASGAVGRLTFSTAVTLAPVGVRADVSASASRVSAANTIALSGVGARARTGASTVASSAVLAAVGVPVRARVGRPSISSALQITLSGVRARALPGAAAFDTSVTIAPAGVPLDARVGVSGLIVIEGRFLALAGIPSPARLGRLVVYIPADAVVRISDRPLTAIRIRTTPLTSIVIADEPSTHIRITHAPLTRIVMADDKTGDYDVGDEAIVTTSYEVASGFEDPTSVAFEVKPPTGAPYTLVYGVDAALLRDSKGHYHATVPLSEHGTWEGYWVATGAAAGGKPWKAKVRPRPF